MQQAPWLDVETQIKMLGNQDDRVRALAIENLRRIGPTARSAIPLLEQMTDDANPRIGQLAQNALNTIRDVPAD